MTKVRLGYEAGTGDPVDVPIIHSVFTGITRHGKSEAMKSMAERAAQAGYKVLLFDVKSKRDYDEIGAEIPVYFEEVVDTFTLRSLLKNVGDGSVSVDFSELVKVCKDGDDYADVLARVEDFLEEGRHPVEENKLIVIQHLLERLVGDLGDVEIVDKVELSEGINVMDLSGVDDSVQQIAISATVEEINDSHEGVVVGIDEAHRFIPQKGKPPANEPIDTLIREGGAADNWVWFSDQTITGIDKDPLKQVDLWLLGRQREMNEASRVLKQIPSGSSYSSEDVMTLSKGHFIVAVENKEPTVYVQPAWMSDDEAQAIAQGDVVLDDVERPETESEEMSEIEEELAEKEQRIGELESKLGDRNERIEELEEQVERLNGLLEQREDDGDEEPAPEPGAGVDEDEVRAIVEEYIEEYETPESIEVDHARTKIIVRHVVEPVEADTEGRLGRVAYLYATGELPEERWFTTGDVADVLERVGWGDTSVKRTSVLTDLAQAGFFEMRVRSDRTREYRISMPPAEAKEKGLLVVDEQIEA